MSDDLLIRARDVLKERWLMAHEHRAFLIRDLAVRVRELAAERDAQREDAERLREALRAIPDTILSPQFYGHTGWGQLVRAARSKTAFINSARKGDAGTGGGHDY